MAATRVFAIPELLESILVHLPPKDLLLSQRTATTFRDTIKASIHLQQALYLRPAPQTPTATISTLNHLLLRPSAFPKKFCLNYPNSIRNTATYCTHSTLHISTELFKFASSQKRSHSFDPSSSWLEMYLITTPSVMTLAFDFKFENDGPFKFGIDGWVEGSMKVQAMTMRDLLGFAVSLYDAASRYREMRRSRDPGDGDAGPGPGVFKWEESFGAEHMRQIIAAPKFLYWKGLGSWRDE